MFSHEFAFDPAAGRKLKLLFIAFLAWLPCVLPCESLQAHPVARCEQVFSMTYQQPMVDKGETPAAGQKSSKRILIVEDNELNLKLFNDLLDAHGYQTIQARNGLDALLLARKYRPDLIIMDIQLPEVSGLEVTRWLKDDDDLCAIPVVAVTAYAMKGDEDRIRQGGCEAYISKPISVTGFISTIQDFIGQATPVMAQNN